MVNVGAYLQCGKSLYIVLLISRQFSLLNFRWENLWCNQSIYMFLNYNNKLFIFKSTLLISLNRNFLYSLYSKTYFTYSRIFLQGLAKLFMEYHFFCKVSNKGSYHLLPTRSDLLYMFFIFNYRVTALSYVLNMGVNFIVKGSWNLPIKYIRRENI